MQRSAPGRARVWAAIGGLAELAVTAGVLLLLFAGYQLVWTTVVAERVTGRVAEDLRSSWQAGAGTHPGDRGAGSETRPRPGAAFALLYIPRLRGQVWATPVVQGVDAAALSRGVGHYPGSALPGQVGNFAVAGHRATHGEPLRDVDRLRSGDMVVVETATHWYVYQLDHDQVVNPDDTWVLRPTPPGAQPGAAVLTVTTCHPRWASTQRWVWWGHLVDTVTKSAGRPPSALVGGG